MAFFESYAQDNVVFPFTKDIREQFYDKKYYHYYVVSTMLYEKIYEIENDKREILSDTYIKVYEEKQDWTCKVGDQMKYLLYKNVNMEKLDKRKLELFNDRKQTIELIDSVLKTNDSRFINRYLSEIVKIESGKMLKIFKLIGDYNRNVTRLSPKAKANLKTLTKNPECLKLLDARRKEKSGKNNRKVKKTKNPKK